MRTLASALFLALLANPSMADEIEGKKGGKVIYIQIEKTADSKAWNRRAVDELRKALLKLRGVARADIDTKNTVIRITMKQHAEREYKISLSTIGGAIRDAGKSTNSPNLLIDMRENYLKGDFYVTFTDQNDFRKGRDRILKVRGVKQCSNIHKTRKEKFTYWVNNRTTLSDERVHLKRLRNSLACKYTIWFVSPPKPAPTKGGG